MLFYRLHWTPVRVRIDFAYKGFGSFNCYSVALKPENIPNLITSLRLFLALPIIWLVLQGHYGEALVLFLIAGFSDGVDGFLAKRYGWISYLGGVLDPLADKLLLMGTILALGWQGELPVWLVSIVVLRDAVIVIMAISYHYLIESFKAEPLAISKLNTLLQILLVLAVLSSKGVTPLPEILMDLLIYGTGLTTFWSGCAYVWEWGRRALRKARRTDVS